LRTRRPKRRSIRCSRPINKQKWPSSKPKVTTVNAVSDRLRGTSLLAGNCDCSIPRPFDSGRGICVSRVPGTQRNPRPTSAASGHLKNVKNAASELTNFVSGASHASESGRGVHHHAPVSTSIRRNEPQGAYLDFAYGHSSSEVALNLPAVS